MPEYQASSGKLDKNKKGLDITSGRKDRCDITGIIDREVARVQVFDQVGHGHDLAFILTAHRRRLREDLFKLLLRCDRELDPSSIQLCDDLHFHHFKFFDG